MPKRKPSEILREKISALGHMIACVRMAWLIRRLQGRETPEQIVCLAIRHRATRAFQVEEELLQFAYLVAARKPKVILEIGTFNGGTLFPISRLADDNALVISLDHGRFNWFREPLLKRFPRAKGMMRIVNLDSHEPETTELVKSILNGQKLDLLFIDGDHSYKGVKKDFEMYAPLVSQDGMVAFHDIVEHPPELHCEVSRFWNEVRKSYRHTEIIRDRQQGWAGIGVLYM